MAPSLARLGWRRAAVGLAVGTSLALATLGAAEIGVRVLAPPPRVNDSQLADDRLGFHDPTVRLCCTDERGGFEFRTNSRGTLGPEFPPAEARDPGIARVLILGDSFLQAWRVRLEEWVGSVLRAELEAGGRAARVFAAAANDYGTGQELLLLRRDGPRVQPEHVVLFVFPANDLPNNTLELAGRTTISANDFFRPYLVPDGSGELAVRYAEPWRALLRHSRLFRFAEQRWLAGQDPLAVRSRLAGERMLDASGRIRAGELPDEFLEIYRPQPAGSRYERAWQRTEALLSACRDEARALGASFTVVVIPEVHQVERMLSSVARENQLRQAGWERPEEVLDLDLPERRLEAFFHEHGIAHVQLLAPLRRRAAELGSTVYLDDGHLSSEGHQLMGRLAAARLAPGGRDVCFEPGAPADLFAARGAPPLELDFSQRQHWSFLGWGWSGWVGPWASPGASGWRLHASGLLAAPSGFVTLSGELTARAGPAAVLSVTPQASSGAALARQRFAAPGPFSISFEVPLRDEGADWMPVWLAVEGTRWGEQSGPHRLLLTRLSAQAAPPAGWRAPLAERPPRRVLARVTARCARLVVRLPAQLLTYGLWRFVRPP